MTVPYPQPDPQRQPPPTWPPVAGPNVPAGAPWASPTPQNWPPNQPYDQQPMSRTNIANYAPPRAKTSVIVAAAIVVALLGVLLAGALIKAAGPSRPTPTVTSESTASSEPGMPFTVPGSASTGRWEVLDRAWTSDGVLVHVRVTATSGTLGYAFEVYAKGESTPTMPTKGVRSPDLSSGQLSEGDSADGYLFFKIPHAESTLFITTRSGRAISALPIRA